MVKSHFDAAVKFGRRLIDTQDLDPVYTSIYRADFPPRVQARIIVAYSCLYHLGASARLAESTGLDFWERLQEAAVNKGLRWPRGSERRHWRGSNATKSVHYLSQRFSTPEAAVGYWNRPSFQDVAKHVQETPSYGPWIAFKVADMLERVMGMPVDFRDCALGVYKEPRAGAALLWTGDTEARISDGTLDIVLRELGKAIGLVAAPPSFNRTINIQEVETVLCKYKAHFKGHYEVGKDIHEVRAGLTPEWGKLSKQMYRGMVDL